MLFKDYDTYIDIDHSQYRQEICFLKEVTKPPVFPPGITPPELTEGVWEQHFWTAPDNRWEGSPRHRYRIRYYMNGKKDIAQEI